MMQAVKWLYLMTLAIWIGSVVFFSFAVAPTVFRVLQPDDAARLQRAIFPKYYAAGIICAAIGLVCAGVLFAGDGLPRTPAIASLLLLAAMGGTDLWLRQSVVPRMAELREQRAAAKEPDAKLEAEWKSRHALSVQLNVVVLLGGMVLLGLFVIAGKNV